MREEQHAGQVKVEPDNLITKREHLDVFRSVLIMRGLAGGRLTSKIRFIELDTNILTM